MKYYVYLVLFSVFLVSGCISLDGIFGGDVINIQETITNSGRDDILLIQDAFIIPTSPVLPDQNVKLSLMLENVDTMKNAENVRVLLFNAPTFKNINGQMCNIAGCRPESNECIDTNPCIVLPGEQKQLTFDLKSPSEGEIANIKTDITFDYLADYDSEGSLVYTMPVVNMDEVIKRQRTGDKTTVTRAKSHGSGPIKIDVDLMGPQYVLAGQPATLIFKIENQGSGQLKNSKIDRCNNVQLPTTGDCSTPIGVGTCKDTSTGCDGTFVPGYCPGPSNIQCCVTRSSFLPPNVNNGCVNNNYMSITFPAGIDLPDYSPSAPKNTAYTSMFDCQGSMQAGWTCTNKKEIEIFKDQSRMSLGVRINVPKEQLGEAPFKSFTIQSSVRYTYELRNSLSLTVNPFHNV